MASRPVKWGSREVFSGALIAAVAVVAVWLILSAARALPGSRFLVEGREALLISAGFEVFFLLIVVWFAIIRRRASLASLGFVRPRNRHPIALAIWAWLTGLVLVTAWAALAQMMGWESALPTRSPRNVIGEDTELWLAFLVVAVVAPFSEEVFFRGFVYSGLRRSLGIVLAVPISAALFALFHVEYALLVPTFIFGIVLAWAYVRSGSIWPPMLAHGLHNAVVLAVAASGLGL